MPVQNKRLEKILEKERERLRKKAEEGKLTTVDLKKFEGEEKERLRKDIKRRQALAKYYRRRKKLIKEGVIKKKQKKYLKAFICDECGKEFKVRYLSKTFEHRFCCNECRCSFMIRYMREKKKEKQQAKPKVGKLYYKYRIVVVRNGIEIKRFGSYYDKDSAIDDYDKIMIENKKVILPKKVSRRNEIEYKYEMLLLKLNEEDLKHSKFPNEYGKLVDHVIEVNPELDVYEWNKKKREKKDWVILNKVDYNYEETFFVYGYDGKYDRKDTGFILDELILNDDEPKQISIYKNKLLIKDDDHIFDLVIGKNKKITLDLYNKIEEICRKNKIKYISFFGFCDGPLVSGFSEKLIQEKTGWEMLKVKKCYSSN
jgi:hypothetical protein